MNPVVTPNPLSPAHQPVGEDSRGQPTWDVAKLFPLQGHWTEAEYLSLRGNYLVEFSNGCVEVLPMPTEMHQSIVAFIYEAMLLLIRANQLGKVLFAPLRVRLASGKFREPDIAFMTTGHASRRFNEFWDGADLVVEVVSDDDRRRDLEVKRLEYAQAGIPEYWIVDPMNSRISVLRLDGDRYADHGIFTAGERAASATIPGLEVNVNEVFAAARN